MKTGRVLALVGVHPSLGGETVICAVMEAQKGGPYRRLPICGGHDFYCDGSFQLQILKQVYPFTWRAGSVLYGTHADVNSPLLVPVIQKVNGGILNGVLAIFCSLHI